MKVLKSSEKHLGKKKPCRKISQYMTTHTILNKAQKINRNYEKLAIPKERKSF